MADSKLLTQLIELLEPLATEERHRCINAALLFLGEDTVRTSSTRVDKQTADRSDAGQEHFPADVLARMRQHGILPSHAVHVFEFRDSEAFKILAVPGRGKKPQTLAMYHLVGLGTYLQTNKREFTDVAARQYCKDYGCYDPANHAAYLDDKHPAFTGDKNSGWLLTVPGIKIAAAIVKEIAETADAE